MRPTKPSSPAKLTAAPARAAARASSASRRGFTGSPRLWAVSRPRARMSISPEREISRIRETRTTQKAGTIRSMDRLLSPPIRKSV